MRDVIQERLKSYAPETEEDEENALKEITQEVVLYGLEQSGFFEHAVFHGGTCLRVIHGLDRFSEDLDFALKRVDSSFDPGRYLAAVAKILGIYGYQLEVTGEDQVDGYVKTRFLKDDSIKKILVFEHQQDLRKKIRIKVEIDVNPPAGHNFAANYLDFPTDFMIMTQDIPSLFAGKCHALLCRSYVKGRDWYDFLWYISRKASLNGFMFSEALNQSGPWQGLHENVTKDWIYEKFRARIKSIDWNDAKKDVSRFLKAERKDVLNLWGENFFLKKTEKLIAEIRDF
ncbi:MAG: nucleotidyl transferase AbiEii/AbiGii toxin family protein, partial [Desulfobacterales bacterium]|nr:nucleotidyl transferase AbiEii/AbiGii toxin family protein [Desulfobacterales bacterium]